MNAVRPGEQRGQQAYSVKGRWAFPAQEQVQWFRRNNGPGLDGDQQALLLSTGEHKEHKQA